MTSPAEATPPGVLWHVGRRPEPWAWVPWEFAGGQRWDDAERTFRTVYAAESRFGCFVEVLAQFRPDPELVAGMAGIAVDPADAREFSTAPAGQIDQLWVGRHVITSALVDGIYCDVTTAQTIAALRPSMLQLATSLGLPDFDAAALKLARPRELTQRAASLIYQLPRSDGELFAGVRFASRHGDDLPMWAIFERPGDEPFSHRLTIQTEDEFAIADPELRQAMSLHHLTWPSRT
jgi:hypothetical protein